jgi:hypothetical protein
VLGPELRLAGQRITGRQGASSDLTAKRVGDAGVRGLDHRA